MVNRANGHIANDHRANGNRADVVAPKFPAKAKFIKYKNTHTSWFQEFTLFNKKQNVENFH